MTSRTTDDYQAMADAGVAAIIEPAFWLGQPEPAWILSGIITAVSLAGKRFRSSQFGIKHYCTHRPQLQRSE